MTTNLNETLFTACYTLLACFFVGSVIRFVWANHANRNSRQLSYWLQISIVLYAMTFVFKTALIFHEQFIPFVTSEQAMRHLYLLSLIINTGLFVGFMVIGVDHANSALRHKANNDPLTGALNRYGFFSLAENLYLATCRERKPLSCLYIDIDHFKRINDTHGHQVGDEILKQFALIIKKALRKGDIVGRLGGEEFAVLLYNSTPRQAGEIAERLRETVAITVFLPYREALHVTASIGVFGHAITTEGGVEGSANNPSPMPIDLLLQYADKALFRAKHDGRNRVVMVDV